VTTGRGWDAVVVGGGAAGVVVASALATAMRRVLLIEAGRDPRGAVTAEMRDGWRLPTVDDWGFRAEAAEGDGPRLRRGRLLGGTSWLTRFAVRGHRADFDAWVAAGNAGWAWEDVERTFATLESDADFGTRRGHGASGPMPITRYRDLQPSPIHAAAIEAMAAVGMPSVDDLNAPTAIGVGRLPMSTTDGRRVTTLDAYLPAEGAPPGLTLRTDTMVDRVVVDHGRAMGLRTSSGELIETDQVIVSCGTYGSPPLLLRSGIGAADELRALGVEVAIDLPGVGRNLADHPAVDLDSGWRGSAADGPMLHTLATFRTSLADGPAPDAMFWVQDPDSTDPAFYVDPILLRPTSRGTVRLRSADPGAPPRITLPGLREEIDILRMIEAYRLSLDIVNQPAFRALCAEAAPSEPASPEAWRARILENAYSTPHVVGTCAMGPDPGRGAVVDADGRVHGIGGLFVIDASIIPNPPSGFPHLITIMLASHLVARLTA
jgi:choline dehydrogenase